MLLLWRARTLEQDLSTEVQEEKGKLERWQVGVQLPSLILRRSLLWLRIYLPLHPLVRGVEGNKISYLLDPNATIQTQ